MSWLSRQTAIPGEAHSADEGSALNHSLPTGEKVCLRTLEAGDLDFLYRWENDPAVWQYGDCGAKDPVSPERFTREELCRFIENQRHGIRANEQLRLVICLCDPCSSTPLSPVGFIDIFNFDPVELRAGVGILICDPADRRRGYGREALKLAMGYANLFLGLRELWCTVAADNRASLALFVDAGFVPAYSELMY